MRRRAGSDAPRDGLLPEGWWLLLGGAACVTAAAIGVVWGAR